MKSITSRSGPFLVWCSMLSLVLHSCALVDGMTEVRTSIDGSKQRYSGDMYPEPSPTADDIGLNIGVIILTSPGGTLPPGWRTHKRRHT